MTYSVIEDFKRGLDRRRTIDTSPAGSLWECVNAHITRGGDIEKRKAFELKYSLPVGTFGMHATAASVYVFGSIADPGMPSGVTYQRLQHQDNTTAMAAILKTENYDGKIYAIAEFVDGDVFHYYDGSRVTSWDTVAASIADNDQVATTLAGKLDQLAEVDASAVGTVITVTGTTIGDSRTITSSATNFGSVNDQTLVTANVQPAWFDTFATVSFDLTGGASGSVNSVTINGVDVLGAPVAFNTDLATTALDVATQINTYVSSPEYSATADGVKVTISYQSATSTPNGYVIAPATTTITTGNIVNMNGGDVNAVQIDTITVGGTFEVADEFTVTIDGLDYKASGASSGTGNFVKTYKSKIYSLVSSLLYFCASNNPTSWGSGIGAGFVNLSNHAAGSEELTSIEVYNQFLAVFSRSVIQTWHVESDDANNIQNQVLYNTGTSSPDSVTSFGDADVFYLSDTGVRSLRARDSSNAAAVSDVGTAIDSYITDHMASLSEQEVKDAVAVIEPKDGRYFLALDGRIYVFSYFPGSKVSAWSTYETGFTVSSFTTLKGRLYARSGDSIYLYGGTDNATYDTSRVEVQLPFYDGGKPATKKELKGVDISSVNNWDVNILVNPNDLNDYVRVGDLSGVTYMDENAAAVGISSHFAPNMVCETDGPAKISNVAMHFTKAYKD